MSSLPFLLYTCCSRARPQHCLLGHKHSKKPDLEVYRGPQVLGSNTWLLMQVQAHPLRSSTPPKQSSKKNQAFEVHKILQNPNDTPTPMLHAVKNHLLSPKVLHRSLSCCYSHTEKSKQTWPFLFLE